MTRRFTRLAAPAALVAMLLAGQTTTATAQLPPDDPEVSASAGARLPSPYNEPTIELVNTSGEYGNRPADQYNSWCLGVQQSRDSEVDLALWEGCSGAGEGWREWDINFTNKWAGPTPLYEIKNPFSGLCLSIEGVESGAATKPDNGHDAQQEPCERQHDALWWFSSDGHGRILVRPYLKNSAGRYPCLEPDVSDLYGWVPVQVWDCSSSEAREWNVILRDSGSYIWP